MPAGTPLANAAEAAVIALAAAGDDAAFSELVRRRQSLLRQLLRRLCRDPSLADDLAQQSFLSAWRALPKLANAAAYWPWLRRVAINTWLAHLRKERQPWAFAGEEPDDLPAPTATPEERMDLDAALALLSPVARLCTVLAYSEGMSHAEIAGVTGAARSSRSGVRNRRATRVRGSVRVPRRAPNFVPRHRVARRAPGFAHGLDAVVAAGRRDHLPRAAI